MEKKSHKSSRNSWIGFIMWPILYFLLSVVVVYITLLPLAKPILSTASLAFTKKVPDFDKEAADIYKEDAVVPETNDLIEVVSSEIPTEGERFGQMTIKSAEIDVPVYFGDSDNELLKGVGTYTKTYLPGAGRTVLMTAHNNTFFHTLGNTKNGDLVSIKTNYGSYVYEITGSKIAKDTDKTAYDLEKKEENLILYTCYPFDMLGLTPDRYFVYAKYISGPKLDLVYQ